MLYKLFFFLNILNPDTAHFDLNNPNKLEIILEETRMDTLNRLMNHQYTEDIVRDCFNVHLESMYYNANTKISKLVFKFK